MSNDNTPWIEPEEFATVKTNDDGEARCMPAEPDDWDWEGLIINAPTIVRAREGQPFFIPICLFGMLPALRENNRGGIMIYAIDLQTQKIYQGPAYIEPPIEDYTVPPPPSTKPTTEELERLANTSVSESFTSDLYGNAHLPDKSAEYRVYMQTGNFRSNEVIIQVVWEK